MQNNQSMYGMGTNVHNNVYNMQNMHSALNGMHTGQTRGNVLCTICTKIRGNERYVQNHKVSNCPFLKTTLCTKCWEYGHMPNYCKSMYRPLVPPPLLSVAPVRCSGESCIGEDYKNCEDCYALTEAKKMEYESMRMNQMGMCERNQNRACLAKYGNMGGCGFCKNSKEYDENNIWFNNHGLKSCPRLALTVCSFCKQRGHTDRHCGMKKCMDGMTGLNMSDSMESMESVEDMVIDLDE